MTRARRLEGASQRMRARAVWSEVSIGHIPARARTRAAAGNPRFAWSASIRCIGTRAGGRQSGPARRPLSAAASRPISGRNAGARKSAVTVPAPGDGRIATK
jgi:hypothetical protein